MENLYSISTWNITVTHRKPEATPAIRMENLHFSRHRSEIIQILSLNITMSEDKFCFAISQETNVKRSVGWGHPNLLHNYIEHEGLKNVGLTLGNIVVEMLILSSSEMIILWAAGLVSRVQDIEWPVLCDLLTDKLIEMIVENVQPGLLHQSVLK